jgi:hypothetical protein
MVEFIMAPYQTRANLGNPCDFADGCQMAADEHAIHPVVKEHNPDVVNLWEEAPDGTLQDEKPSQKLVEPSIFCCRQRIIRKQFDFALGQLLLFFAHKKSQLYHVHKYI